MALRGVIGRIQDLPEPANEEAAKLQVILPILQELGWDHRDPSKVAPEHSVGGGRVDFALLGPSGKPVAVIEAKAPGARFEDRDVKQVMGYAFYAGVNICVLTKGLLWWLYLPREEGRPPAECRFSVLEIKMDPLDSLIADFEAYLAYDALASDRAKQKAKQALNETTFLPIWKEMLHEPLDELIDLVERISRSTGIDPSRDRVVHFLRRQGSDSTAPTSDEPASSHTPQPTAQKTLRSSPPTKKPDSSPSKRKKPTAYVLFGERYPALAWKALWIGVAERLYERHGDEGFEKVVGKPDGTKSYVERDRSGLKNPHRVSDSRYWIGTFGSQYQLVPRCKNLLRNLGHSEDDLRILFD